MNKIIPFVSCLKHRRLLPLQKNASYQDRTDDLQFTRLTHYHCAKEAWKIAILDNIYLLTRRKIICRSVKLRHGKTYSKVYSFVHPIRLVMISALLSDEASSQPLSKNAMKKLAAAEEKERRKQETQARIVLFF